MNLHRFWFRFGVDHTKLPLGLGPGCGVTAYDYDDAKAILIERVFRGASLPPIVEYIEDVDVSTLDSGHVLPNMASPHERGVWFPQGYD